jgi:ABC-type branched-subunit amino acid transport system ATPase component
MLLQIHDVHVGYKKLDVLHGVSLAVEQEEIVALIGPNGAGKSTLLKAIFGVLKPHQGFIHLNGNDISSLKPRYIVRQGVSYVPQGQNVFPSLTALENLEMGGVILQERDVLEERIESVFRIFPILKERRKQRAKLMSGGEQQMLAIGRALMLQPELLLLDEPSLGLSPKFFQLIFEKILEINALGTAILIVEQNARQALTVSHRGYVLELGRNRLDGPSQELLNSNDVKRLYLGS